MISLKTAAETPNTEIKKGAVDSLMHTLQISNVFDVVSVFNISHIKLVKNYLMDYYNMWKTYSCKHFHAKFYSGFGDVL